jgi:hypothetical protein
VLQKSYTLLDTAYLMLWNLGSKRTLLEVNIRSVGLSKNLPGYIIHSTRNLISYLCREARPAISKTQLMLSLMFMGELEAIYFKHRKNLPGYMRDDASKLQGSETGEMQM